ncbi:MAG: acylphosphatase [Thermoproteota archaeon]|jgi:acylphosphatase|uniref:Acylphosphatase n=1 Tax=Candidatus Methanodesulfokora washburnensis TaxID=2478471 RepID=A0A3R9QGF0_9CREN|nr:acylphosphatase [Candidatus Methanodesulfokores washburnensis]RSN75918.1 acylphosphatase [Candidatus Methanodesulfokores washburnensis]RZN62488.1 MAG: acylphosphatase [Candidatus Methanodesulfokores washburnensis]TDA39330.1 MAG: acylphosphatase [Candidatus Korarchaeota archaeon]
MSLARAHLRIYGWVQGVFFRSSMRRVAKKLGVTGWVRNLPDGSVEAVVEGEKDKVEEIIRWAHKGPELAVVERVDVEWEEPTGEFDDFSIIY